MRVHAGTRTGTRTYIYNDQTDSPTPIGTSKLLLAHLFIEGFMKTVYEPRSKHSALQPLSVSTAKFCHLSWVVSTHSIFNTYRSIRADQRHSKRCRISGTKNVSHIRSPTVQTPARIRSLSKTFMVLVCIGCLSLIITLREM